MTKRQTWFRLALPALVLLLAGVAAFFPATPASAASAAKSCALSGSNTYICTFTITPAVPLTPGPMLVQMITPGPGTFSGASVVTSSPGCTNPASVSGGSYISPQSGTADYDVVVGAGGCTSAATITVTEMVTVTASGQVCQRVWVNAGSPFTVGCATVTYTPPPPPPAIPSATKSCTLTSAPNVYACLFTVVPAFPAIPGDIIHVNEPPGPPMTGPARSPRRRRWCPTPGVRRRRRQSS